MKIKTNEIQIALGVLGLGGLLFTLNYSVYKVEPGFQAIKFSKITGVGSKVYKEGLHLLLPWFERPLIYDCRMKNIIFNCDCGTSDLQMIKVKIRLLSRPNLDRLPDIYRRLGMDYDKRIFESLVFEICGAVIAQFNASQLINQRDTISMNMRQRLIERAREFFIDVDDVSIIDIFFGKEFSEAIEKKQVAQQDAERMKFLVDQALEDKKSTIIKATGEAESVRKFGEANQINTAFLELRKIETARKISNLLKDSRNKIILDTNSLYMNLPSVPENKKIINKV